MRIRSVLAAGGLAAAVVAGLAAPAFAHEEINPRSFPTGQPTFFTLTAANESKANLVKIVLKAPAGTPFGETTRSPAGWTVVATDDTITWTGGAVKPDNFDTWGYEIDSADQPGTLAYKVTLGFADGRSDDVEVDVTATGATGSGAAAGASSTTVTTAAAPAGSAAGGTGGGSDDGKAKAALALSIVALLVAAVALARGARRRSAPAADGGGAGGAAGDGAGQDW